jgi:hypothetical protein
VRPISPALKALPRILCAIGLWICLAGGSFAQQPQPPAPSGARILLLPRKLVTGERSTLAVLDVNGRLTPGVNIVFSDGDKVTTDTTGRAMFVPPLTAGTLYASIDGRSGRVSATVLAPADAPSGTLVVDLAPRVASLSDRFELMGHGFCSDADANRVTIGSSPALVLASSPAYLAILPPADLNPGPALVQVSCGEHAGGSFTIVFLSLELEASSAPLAPGEHRAVVVRVKGTTTKVSLEARNLATDVADLTGGETLRVASSGATNNVAQFEMVGKKRGNFVISIRLFAPLSAPRP